VPTPSLPFLLCKTEHPTPPLPFKDSKIMPTCARPCPSLDLKKIGSYMPTMSSRAYIKGTLLPGIQNYKLGDSVLPGIIRSKLCFFPAV
jgi:hypothetical protein